ncbi:hypothetical protein ASG87_18135 [Frateuria sp. Soil773]|uniref:hypothetical protein n=1 Tax=Frateuria sp. Soil773 TaxID=1736407 RepID=UPI0006F4AEA9|nr:hypothetical protein [Frateuria sp. Soil773]KRE93755.1 hypothetical protein ASG87_18135 [Frateuria sp. Soil773]
MSMKSSFVALAIVAAGGLFHASPARAHIDCRGCEESYAACIAAGGTDETCWTGACKKQRPMPLSRTGNALSGIESKSDFKMNRVSPGARTAALALVDQAP